MAERPRYLGLSEFVEQMSNTLMNTPFERRYRSERPFRADVLKVVRGFVSSRLDPLDIAYEIRDAKKTGPVSVFGADFWPDLSVDVSAMPTVAIGLGLIRPGESPTEKISSAVGRAIIYARQYPSVVSLILDLGEAGEHELWIDREFTFELWSRLRIKLIVRPW